MAVVPEMDRSKDLILLLLLCYSIGFAAELRSGLTVQTFRDLPHVLEVVCTGQTLAAGSDLLVLTLYSEPSRTKLSSVNLRSHKCTASAAFAACLLDERDSRRSSLHVLVTGLEEGESTTFGCEAGFTREGWMVSEKWSVDVTRNRKLHYGFNSFGPDADV